MISYTQISLQLYPYVSFLSSKWIMNKYLNEFEKVGDELIEETILLECRRIKREYPDYIYRPYLEYKDFGSFFLKSLDKLSDFLEWKFDSLWIKNETLFEEWQNIITLISPLLPITFYFYKNDIEEYKFFDFLRDRDSLLLSYYDVFLENEIIGNIAELHLHLNGTTESDKVWCDILKAPYRFYADLKKGFQQREVKQLFHQFDVDFNEKVFFRYLLLARKIRDHLYLKYVAKEKNLDTFLDMENYDGKELLEKSLSYSNHPMENIYNTTNMLLLEGLFYFRIFSAFEKMTQYDKKLFHLYLLIKSVLIRFLTQQLDQYGFDQFQYITMNEMREMSEKSYLHRFKQLESFYKRQLLHLEGRFSPKSDFLKLKRLVDRIIKDFDEFKKSLKDESEKRREYSLKLVAHFIKKPDQVEDYLPYRFYKLRNDLKKQAINLVSLLNLDNYNYREHEFKYSQYIAGIDAAANELHAPPEVFAPIFRLISRRFRNKGFLTGNKYLGITYHCGEDFVHLLSGIRAVFEAINFLDMKERDRIGHATALGIAPEVWLNKISSKLKIKQGEWLDNLIFAYYLITEHGIDFNKLDVLKEQIRKLARDIYYLKECFSFSQLIGSYFCRKLDPEIVFSNNPLSLLPVLDLEEVKYERILGNQFFQSGFKLEDGLELLEKYHSYECYIKYNKMIEIETNFFDSDILTQFQEIILKELNQKKIAIETMPTSNLRISFYEKYEEHHLYRWLNEMENKPTLIICSDDPGIFATNLRNEYLHVKKFIKDKNQLLEIAQNSRHFSF